MPDKATVSAALTGAAAAASSYALYQLLMRRRSARKKIKLSYLNIEGAGEQVRLALHLAGIPFEDHRFTFSEWAGGIKATTPYGQCPVMVVDDGPMMAMSGAMLNFVASIDPTGSLYPEDLRSAIDVAIGLAQDLRRDWSVPLYIGIQPTKFGLDEGYPQTEEGRARLAALRTSFVATDLPKYLRHFEDLLDKSGGPFLCGGDRPTLADCVAVPAIRTFTRGAVEFVDPGCVAAASPKIAAYVEGFCALEEVREHCRSTYPSGLGSGK